MTALRFLHTADIHLGKPFGGYAAADRLRVARQDVISRLVAAAREGGAANILVAGDLFETPNPSAQTWRQAAAEMAEASGLTWWLLPGNHDNLREGTATWDGIEAQGHPNLRVLRDPEPVEMQPGAVLLPAPLVSRRPASDPTAWMDDVPTPEGAIRIGLAHGPIQGFSEGEMPPDIVAPDRDRRAGLDWLALGDWHGAMHVSDRVAYAGSPERTGFGHDGRGSCFLVTVDGAGAAPRVSTVETGTFDWRTVTLDLVPGDDPAEMVAAALPSAARRDMLVKVVAKGRVPLRDASVLAALENEIGADFCHFEVNMGDLATEIETADLDVISSGGALRVAADELARSAGDASLAEREQRIAEASLRRLHAIMLELDE
ncbi:MAG: DNA repair exonuclease [Silicimonas sp.]